MAPKTSNASSRSCGDQKHSFASSRQSPIDGSPSSYESQPQKSQFRDRVIGNKTVRSLFAFTTRQHVPVIAVAAVFTLLSGLIRPASAIMFGKLWNSLTSYGAGTIDAQSMLHQAAMWGTALTLLGLGTWIIEGSFLALWMRFGDLQAKNVREIMFSGMRDKSMEWYDLREDGIASMLNRIETQTRELQLATSQPLGLLFLETTTAIAGFGTAFFFSWKLTFLIIATVPVAAGLVYLTSRSVGPAIENQKRELSRASKYAHNAVAAIESVKAFNGEDQEVWQYFLTSRAVTSFYMIQARANAIQSGILKFFAVAMYVSSFWFGLYLTLHDGATVGHILTTFVACASAMQAAEIILPQYLVLAKGISAGETLKSIITEMRHRANSKNEDGDTQPNSCPGDIEINDISFAYPSNPKQNVLNNATFFFPAGETTYVVGKSGSGKSTIGNLLMKYYDPSSGEVLIDGQPIQNLDTNWLRQNVMLIQQQSVMFNETISQNIQFGRQGFTPKNDIRLAARSACIEQAIDELPEGFDTVVGSQNRALSGGQSQRISVARAQLRNASILILDESTSALDQTVRAQVMESIREWRRGKTTIIITHDVSQILDDDYVYVLEHAKVVQEGYRKGLAEKTRGTFARFCRGDESIEASKTPKLRPKSVPASPIIEDPADVEKETPRAWKRLSQIFYDAPPLQSNRYSLVVPGAHMSVGGGPVAQASAIREKDGWSSPVISGPPGDRISQRMSAQLMPFLAPKSSPQVPAPAITSSGDRDHDMESAGSEPLRNPFLTPSEYELSTISLSPEERFSHVPASASNETAKDIESGTYLHLKPASLEFIFASVWPAISWKERGLLAVGLCCAAIVGAATPTFGWLFSQLLNTYYTPENRTALATKWALAMLASAFVDGSAYFAQHYCLEYSGQAWINSLRVESLRRILAQPKSWFDNPRNTPSRLTNCLDRDAEEMRNLLGRFLGVAIMVGTMVLVTVTWAFIIEWKLTLVFLAAAPVLYVVTRISHWTSGMWEARCNLAAETTSTIFGETFSNIRVVRALTLEAFFEKKHLKAINEAFQVGRTRACIAGCMFGLTDSMSYFIVSLIFYYGAVMVNSGDATVNKVLTCINVLLITSSNAIGMFCMIPQLNSSRTTATQVLHLARLPLNGSHEAQGTKRLVSPFPIRFNNLSFTYPSRPHIKTLNGISFEITPGSCTAIVGPSGSGKSTIASLLLGLYPPDAEPGRFLSSSLTFAGKSIFECNIHNIRSHMAFVAQTPLLFPTTIFANITYGLPETSPYNNLFAVEQAATAAGIHDFIVSLESGYNTLIGEGGMGLSGGQAQRVAIARALVRRPKVLVMDEATSALDAESADGIRETVKRLRAGGGGMAVLIISHSVDMMRVADTVIMVDNGKVVEKGGFEELKRARGPFATLIGEGKRPPVVKVQTGLGVDLREEFMTPVRPRSKMEWPKKTSF